MKKVLLSLVVLSAMATLSACSSNSDNHAIGDTVIPEKLEFKPRGSGIPMTQDDLVDLRNTLKGMESHAPAQFLAPGKYSTFGFSGSADRSSLSSDYQTALSSMSSKCQVSGPTKTNGSELSESNRTKTDTSSTSISGDQCPFEFSNNEMLISTLVNIDKDSNGTPTSVLMKFKNQGRTTETVKDDKIQSLSNFVSGYFNVDGSGTLEAKKGVINFFGDGEAKMVSQVKNSNSPLTMLAGVQLLARINGSTPVLQANIQVNMQGWKKDVYFSIWAENQGNDALIISVYINGIRADGSFIKTALSSLAQGNMPAGWDKNIEIQDNGTIRVSIPKGTLPKPS